MSKHPVIHSTFVIKRNYPHAPEKVFAAFADPVKKRRWMGGDDDGFVIESFEPNFKVEGYERWRFRFKDGPQIANDTCYQDIIPNKRIVYVYKMAIGDQLISSSQTTIELVPTPAGTDLIFTEQGAFFEGAEGPKGREDGTRGLLEELAKELMAGTNK